MGTAGSDRFGLQRFVLAQADCFDDALAELHAGCKRTHWMWFVFPQLAGLGRSPTAQRYAIGGPDEARAYLAHPLLGPRLLACTEAVLVHSERSVQAIFGAPDDRKFHSSLTLFDQVSGPGSPFSRALEVFFAGRRDPATLVLLGVGEHG